ncbi:hypothetical protein, partial [Staphylococcus aureus]
PKYEQGDNSVDIDCESVPQIQCQKKGAQTFGEDREKDNPKYKQGGNLRDIDLESVPQIK